MTTKADIGLIGLAVMGENLVLNMESKGYTVAVFNRTINKVKGFLNGRGKDKNIVGTETIAGFIAALKKPRKVILMVKAGNPIDALIEELLPVLEKGDIIIDGGNSHFLDTVRRANYLESKGYLYVGAGVSGGEEGALRGPSIMPGGSFGAWYQVKEILQKSAAKVQGGQPCCQWIGSDGAGHFVKMVHNGIEYGDMQLICEAYQIMRDLLGMSSGEMSRVFASWNEGELNSYLIEITRDILAFNDEDGTPMVEKILDTAGQKGTGKWAGVAALELGVPLTLIGEAVFARCLSALKEERQKAAKILKGPKKTPIKESKDSFLEALRASLYAAKIVSYAQGFALMRAAACQYGWELNYAEIAKLWRGGCIIRSVFLDDIARAFTQNHDLCNLLLDPFFMQKIAINQESWRRVTGTALMAGIPIACFGAALSYFDSYRSARLPANLLQAQRDYFGAHMYERNDKPRGEFFHTNWTGRGGTTVSTSYKV